MGSVRELALCLSVIFSLAPIVIGIQEDAVSGGVGPGKVFDFFSVESVGVVGVGEGGCCDQCQRVAIDTQMFDLDHNTCLCYKQRPGKQPQTVTAEGFQTGVCEEALGAGHFFAEESVAWKGSVNGVKEHGDCCRECHNNYGEVVATDFNEAGGHCSCLEAKPGIKPYTTKAQGFYANLCV